MRHLLILLICFVSNNVFAQHEALIQKLDNLKELIPTVENGKESHAQSISFDKENPYRITFTRITTNLKKGEDKTETSEFHIGMLDKNLVKVKTSKKEMEVIIGSGKNDLIKKTEEEKSKGYDNEFSIYCDDIDNARAIQDSFKAIIPLAEKIWEEENQLPTDFDGLFKFIKSNIGETQQGDEDRTEQSLEQESDFKDRANFSIEKFSKKGLKSQNNYFFSFGDLNPSKVRTDFKNETVKVNVYTQKKKNYIKVTEEEKEPEFTDGIEFFFNTPEQAILVEKAIAAIIPLAKKKIKERLPAPSSLEEAKKSLQDLLTEITIKDKTIEQTIEFDDNLTVFKIKTSDENKSNDEERIFDFGDFSGKTDSKVSKNEATVTLKTNNSKDFIQVIEAGEQKNYDDEVTLYANSIETHRRINALIPYIVKKSKRETAPGDLKWLSEEVEKISEIKPELNQTLQKESDDNSCKIQLKLAEDDGKKPKEVLSEFNFYDIDIRTVELEIKGKNVSVVGKTVGKEEVIQQYIDGEKLTFQKELKIPVQNIASGKKMVATFKKLIEECEQ